MKAIPTIVLALALLFGSSVRAQNAPRVAQVPSETLEQTLAWLARLKSEQIRAARGSDVFHGFSFHDALPGSGISFKHRVVDEAGKNFKPNHYDHGGAIAAADVDGDGLIDLFFVNQRGGNELWRNLGGGKFENITAHARVGLEQSICVGASFGDIDNDGWPDLFVTTVNMGNHLFRNEGGGAFRDISASAGITAKGHSSGAVFFDYDRDGLLDLFVCNVGVYTTGKRAPDGSFHAYDNAFSGFLEKDRLETSTLYRNLGGLKFKIANADASLEHREWTGDATFTDLEGSGFPSLYAVSMSGHNAFYRNSAGRFRDETRRTFGRTPFGAMGVKFFDFNQDGRLDLYLTDMHSDMNTAQMSIGATNRSPKFAAANSEPWCSVEWARNNWPGASTNHLFGNAFYLNGESGFTEVSQRINAETYWPWGISVGDLNADGFEDVFVTAGMGYPLHYWYNSVLLNEGGKAFQHSEFLLGVEPRPGGRVLIDYFTLECGGADRGHPFCLGKSEDLIVRASTSSRSSVLCDWDEDGDLDLAVNNMADTPLLLRSDLSEKRAVKFLKVRLRGTISNRDGLGAKVTVMTLERSWTQFHDGKSGYLAQSSLPLYFGLGDARAERVEVVWPSGRRQSVSLAEDQRSVTIVEPRE